MAAARNNLDKYQCMFTWHKEIPYPVSSTWVVNAVEDKLLSSDCDWTSIVYHLVLVYENFKLRKLPAARDHLTACEDIISQSECILKSPLVDRNLVGIKHVLYSTWLHLVDQSESKDPFDTIEDYTTEIPIYKKMTPKQKAGVVGIHAACLMQYGAKGNRYAVHVIQQAIKYDEHEGHWHYLKAEALRYERLRCLEIEANHPSKDELESYRLAHFYDDHTPSHFIGLAASLYDSVTKENQDGPSEERDKATQLYKTALESWPNSVYVNIMSTIGLLTYSYAVRDTKLSDQCLGKSLRLAPQSCLVNAVAGIFFKWPANNEKSATRYFNKAMKRYSSLISDINLKKFKNYRHALMTAIAEEAPLDFFGSVDGNNGSSSDDEDFYDEIIGVAF